MFNGSRLRLARMRRGLTKRQLAERAALSMASITNYEAGKRPTPESLDSLSLALRFPREFFEGDDFEVPKVEAVSFRALASMTAKRRDAAIAASVLAVELSDWIAEKFTLPEQDISQDVVGMGPELAAETLRRSWGLGDAPVENMLHLLEVHGIRVFTLTEDCLDLDAFSFWRDGTPFVFLNTRKSAERSRFDAAHELGHLAMHRGSLKEQETDREGEAQAFAAAFLMPRASVYARFRGVPTLDALIEQKHHWGVSVAALAHRLHDIGYITAWFYRILCMNISQAGYRTDEPAPMQREASQIMDKVFRQLREDGTHRRELARALRIIPEDLDSLVYGLVMTPVPGASTVSTVASGHGPIIKLVPKAQEGPSTGDD